MKILQVLPSLEIGGVERGVIDLARAMKQRGHDTVVVSSGGALVNELQKIAVPHYELPVNQKSLFSLSLVSKLAAIIEKERIDIVHARSRVPAWIAWLAARKTHRPFITTCHGYYAEHPLSAVMGWGKRVIVISSVIGRHMIDDFKVPPERVRLVHRGVDLSQFVYAPRIGRESGSDARRPFRIINVGRLSPIKGQVEFVKAIHEVRKQVPNLEVWIVGSENKGKTKYTELIQKTIRQLNLQSCVQMLGTRRDIPELLRQSDLLVLGTLMPEAFGRVIVEAGAMGTPVISTALGGVLDIIDSGLNGYLVLPGNIAAMAEKMVELIRNPELAKSFAEKLREKVARQFSLDQMAEGTLRVYQEALDEKKILVIKLAALGDIILAVPSLRMLRKRFPEARITVMADKKFAGLLSQSPYVDEIIPVDREKFSKIPYLLKLAKRLRRDGFDISVDLQNSKWTHLLVWLGGIGERYGFSRGLFRRFLNRRVPMAESAEAPVKNQFRILARMGVRDFDGALELWADPCGESRIREWLLPITASKNKIGFVMGSSPLWPSKRWPEENFLELSRRLTRELGSSVVLIGSAGEGISGTDWKEESGVLNLIGKTGLEDLVPLMNQMDVLVTGDTAPLHIAAAVQTPVVALFGPTDPKRHMPPARHAEVLVKNVACQPCYSGTCRNREDRECLKQITVLEVFQAVRKLLFKKESGISV